MASVHPQTLAGSRTPPNTHPAVAGHTDRGRFVGQDTHADVAVVVVTYNSAADIPPLIDDLRVAAHDRRVRVIVVDNQSIDATAEVVRAHQDIVFIEAGGNLGYGGGMNTGLREIGDCDAVLMINPDLRLRPTTISRLLDRVADERVGAVVPLMLDEHGRTYPSLRREPSLCRAIGDAFLGSKVTNRPAWTSEVDTRAESYRVAHEVDWATGAALLVPAVVAREVGGWWDEYPIYSEETDYFRRIRNTGRRIVFEPSAVVEHRGAGSGASRGLAALMAVNRIRYAERYHGRFYSAMFRGVVVLAEALRSYDSLHRYNLAVAVNRKRWRELPAITKPAASADLRGPHHRGAVIVPAFNEASVIKTTLDPLSRAAVEGFIELIVVCNGCSDDTAGAARSVPGVRVVELTEGSKPAALNAGDEAATVWPRMYLDADIRISPSAILAVLDRLAAGDVLVARPASRYDTDGASALVRRYYRARERIPQHKSAMWGAGVYGVNAEGHRRFGVFPAVTGDDLFVDTRFADTEKAVVDTEPSVVKTPNDLRCLLAVLRRGHRGGAELSTTVGRTPARFRGTGLRTAVTVVQTIRGPGSAMDAVVYLAMAVAARSRSGEPHSWERDESSRAVA